MLFEYKQYQYHISRSLSQLTLSSYDIKLYAKISRPILLSVPGFPGLKIGRDPGIVISVRETSA